MGLCVPFVLSLIGSFNCCIIVLISYLFIFILILFSCYICICIVVLLLYMHPIKAVKKKTSYHEIETVCCKNVWKFDKWITLFMNKRSQKFHTCLYMNILFSTK